MEFRTTTRSGAFTDRAASRDLEPIIKKLGFNRDNITLSVAGGSIAQPTLKCIKTKEKLKSVANDLLSRKGYDPKFTGQIFVRLESGQVVFFEIEQSINHVAFVVPTIKND